MTRKTKRVLEPVVGFKRHYSGVRSLPFWNVVNALPDSDRTTLYLLGCALQDIEGRMIQLLMEAQERQRAGR